MLDAIIKSMEEIKKRGIACNMTVECYGDGLRFGSYIATNNEPSPSHLKHESLGEVLERFNDYLKNSKGECVKFWQDQLERAAKSKAEAQDKLIYLTDWKVGESNES